MVYVKQQEVAKISIIHAYAIVHVNVVHVKKKWMTNQSLFLMILMATTAIANNGIRIILKNVAAICNKL
jgi:hypothetical protein